MLRIFVAELFGNERTPIPALGGELLIAEYLAHQHHPQVRSAPPVDSWFSQGGGEAEAGERRNDHVESITGITAKGGRIGQRTNHLMQIPESPRPAVRKYQRYW